MCLLVSVLFQRCYFFVNHTKRALANERRPKHSRRARQLHESTQAQPFPLQRRQLRSPGERAALDRPRRATTLPTTRQRQQACSKRKERPARATSQRTRPGTPPEISLSRERERRKVATGRARDKARRFTRAADERRHRPDSGGGRRGASAAQDMEASTKPTRAISFLPLADSATGN
ncbi:hypothetical protein HPB51_009448 [Rhipicephalus microplus]|uniref:Uncharacterized protein n=1 Tax=Rhipicephalus microplus TaxID=6941 RepID=A0A9J6DU30_RHIMP|nr:hypothetical protein HPB51_009448 [Rhipicephalus microplus]